MTYDEAIAYIENVIKTWSEFGKGHRPFIEALRTILQHNNVGGNNELTEHTTRNHIS